MNKVKDPCEVFLDPSKELIVQKVNQMWSRRVIVIVFQGTVEYGGRAKSKLNEGRYLFLSKPDGTLLIHGPKHMDPINWQPPNSRLTATNEGKNLRIISSRSKVNEKVVVSILNPYVLLFTHLEKGSFKLWRSEEKMVETIFSSPELLEDGFKPIKREAKTPWGKIDLVGRDKSGNVVVCEFKRKKAQISSVSQLKRYLRYSEDVKNKNKHEMKLRGILIAPDISSSAMRLLKRYNLEFRSLPNTLSQKKVRLGDFFQKKTEEG